MSPLCVFRSMGCSMDKLVFVSSWSQIARAKLQIKVDFGKQARGCVFVCLVSSCVCAIIPMSFFVWFYCSHSSRVFQVGGLQLEGCTYDGVCLGENQHNSPIVSAVPTCYMAWVLQVCVCWIKFVHLIWAKISIFPIELWYFYRSSGCACVGNCFSFNWRALLILLARRTQSRSLYTRAQKGWR